MRDPHPLDDGYIARLVLDRAAAYGFSAQVGENERSPRWPHLMWSAVAPLPGSKPRWEERRLSSPVYARKQRCASELVGVTWQNSTWDAVMSRAAIRIALTSSARWASSSGSKIDAANSSLRSSRVARSVNPFGVSRATRTRASSALGVTVMSCSL